MNRFEELSRDELRKEVAKLKIISYAQRRKLKNAELINLLTNYQNNNQINNNQNNNNINNLTDNSNRIYREYFNGNIIDTTYINNDNSV